MAEPYLGDIMVFGGNFAPRGWALCQGTVLSIAQNTALFSLLGTTYGGNGQTTFALPDLSGRMPVHFGSGGGAQYDLGEIGGAEQVTLVANQLPSHSHTPAASNAPGTRSSPVGNVWANSTNSSPYAASGDVSMAPTGTTGGGQPHSNRQPYLAFTIVICIEGVYPPRP